MNIRIAIYRDVLEHCGLDRDRALVGAIIATSRGSLGTLLLSSYVRAYVRDLREWSAARVESFLARHDDVMATI